MPGRAVRTVVAIGEASVGFPERRIFSREIQGRLCARARTKTPCLLYPARGAPSPGASRLTIKQYRVDSNPAPDTGPQLSVGGPLPLSPVTLAFFVQERARPRSAGKVGWR